jgi:L-aspartate oxidase
MKTMQCDYIVIGSGIAGLRAALELARAGSVKVFCKGEPSQSNTQWAQGGIAAAMQEGDTVEFHLQDTLNAGDGLCWEPAVRVLVEEGPRRIEELVAGGAEFDSVNGKFVFGREGAHSKSRILHSGDATGREIVRALLNWTAQTPGIEIVSHMPAVDLLIRDQRCCGIFAMDESTGARTAIAGKAVLLASGGAGQIYSHTTNPEVATADGCSMAFRAGADMMDLEFFQFHPTAFHYHGAPRFLMTEALRGEGATLRNIEGKTFMKEYHPMGDLAPRDVVSRAIISELQRTHSRWALLDATSIGKRKLHDRFPNICRFLETYQLDPWLDLIPVSPSAHYWMGGVKTGLSGETSIPGLYAAGEVACAGVHGANRLASNSLLEGLVFGARAGETMAATPSAQIETPASAPDGETGFPGDGAQTRRKLQSLNWEYLGLIRNETGMKTLLQWLESIPVFSPRNLAELELLNLLDCSKLMVRFALFRQESRGSHYREDFPSKNPQLAERHTVLRKNRLELIQLEG